MAHTFSSLLAGFTCGRDNWCGNWGPQNQLRYFAKNCHIFVLEQEKWNVNAAMLCVFSPPPFLKSRVGGGVFLTSLYCLYLFPLFDFWISWPIFANLVWTLYNPRTLKGCWNVECLSLVITWETCGFLRWRGATSAILSLCVGRDLGKICNFCRGNISVKEQDDDLTNFFLNLIAITNETID